MSGCGGTPHEAIRPTALASTTPDAARPADPDLDRAPPRKLLAIDWSTVSLARDGDALALWTTIAPTGDDWEEKLGEIPAPLARPLAVALLRSGNFACMKPAPVRDCAPPLFDVDPPALTAGLGDPCLRRLLAVWAIAQLEPADVPNVMDAYRGIAAIPPPESQLVAAALQSIPESAPAARLELAAIAWRAGQRDLANSAVGRLDEPHLIAAAGKHHIAGALEILSAKGHRGTYLTAVADDALPSAARTQAIGELVALEDPLSPELKGVLVKATQTKDCAVAASAARWLELRGDKRFVPARPRTGNQAAMMRALCVLASYEPLQRADETSLLATYVPPKGLERISVAYDPYSDVDTDGDGDPHTQRTVDLVPRGEVVLPEVEDLGRAFTRCSGSTCTSADRAFRFVWTAIGGQLFLGRIELVERPPCRR